MTQTSGAYNRSLSLDVIDDALKERGPSTRRSRRLAEDVLLRQLRQCELIRRQIDRLLFRSSKADSTWVPDLELVQMIAKNAEVTKAMVDAIRQVRQAEQAARKGLTDEQLDKVAIAHLTRLASEMTDDQRRAMIAVWFGPKAAERLVPLAEGS